MAQKIKVFAHFVDVPETDHISKDLVARLFDSGLINVAEVYFHCNYNPHNYEWLRQKCMFRDNVHFVYNNGYIIEAEIPTLINLKASCDDSSDDTKVLYIHHKGASRPTDKNVMDWKDVMAHFNINKWEDCVKKLDEGYDTCGINWREDFPIPHYSGNFWWANASYIKKLKKLLRPAYNNFQPQYPIVGDKYEYQYRHDAEFWIGSGKPKACSLWNSGIDHYRQPYPASLYK